MQVRMVGIEHGTAGVEIREAFAIAGREQAEILQAVARSPSVSGCVLVSTCNRSELYLSHPAGADPDGVDLLCRALALDSRRYRVYCTERKEAEAVRHLARVAGGLRSRVIADDQITGQIRAAMETAREAGVADPILETLFRCAATAGKRIRAAIPADKPGRSVAAEAVAAVAERLGGLAGAGALVIGNGNAGRLAAGLLADRGAEVAVTLRAYRHGRPAAPPDGCRGVPFEDRFAAMEGRRVLLSATASPHFTVQADAFRQLRNPPELCVDLAVPRDIDPAVGELPGVTLWNVDRFRTDSDAGGDDGRFAQTEDTVQDALDEFERWRRNRRLRTRRREGAPDFPLFINLHGAGALVVGGGKIGTRRAEALLEFGARVRVVAPDLSPGMARFVGRDGFQWEERRYRPDDLNGVTLAIAATDDRETNRRVGADARERGVLVSVADRREECTFYFPAIVRTETLTAGLVSRNNDHAAVKKAAANLRKELERIARED